MVLSELRAELRRSAPLLVAFSGGVDSTVLLCAALDAAGPAAVLAVTAHGDVHTQEETGAARAAAARMGARHMVLHTHELQVPGFADNPPDRCYLCKHDLYKRLVEMAKSQGISTVVDGANADDQYDFRPGLQAARVLGVRSPLAEAHIGKQEVRALAREWGLPEWDRPSSPCLASRFPYGRTITAEGLAMVAAAEAYLRQLGLGNVRVRHYGEVARIEVEVDDIPRLVGQGAAPAGADLSVRHDIVEHLRGLGYKSVTLDPRGFRSGSLNEGLQTVAAQEDEG